VAAEDLERKYEQFRQEFTVVYRKTLTLSRELASELSYLEQEAASVLVDGFIEELKEKYSGALVSEYLEEVRHHLLDNLEPFKEREGEEEPAGGPPPDGNSRSPSPERDPFRVYGVNVLLAHNDEDGSPVIFETTPTYTNLFGTIQRSYDSRGGWNSDFMDLRAGSILRADGHVCVRRDQRSRRLAHAQAHVEPRTSRNSAARNVLPVRNVGAETRTDRH
jgi:predicted ATP-dependent protease